MLTMSQSSWRSSPSWVRRGRDGRRRKGGEIFFNTGDISICEFVFVYMYLCICNTNEKEGGFVSLNTGDIST